MPRHRTMTATHNNAGIAAGYLKTRGDMEIKDWNQALAFVTAHGDYATISPNTKNLTIRITAFDTDLVTLKKTSPASITIRLYKTDIITYHSDGTAECDNGGFDTPTTVSRVNQFGPRGWWFSHSDRKLMAWNPTATVLCVMGNKFKVFPEKG